MANFNKIIVEGRLGADPEMRYSTTGTAVCSLRLANGQYDKEAENHEITTWYRVTLFGKRAEAANQYLAKGSRVLIEGKHRIRKYSDKDGNERESNEIMADDFSFLDSKKDGEIGPSRAPEGYKPAKRALAPRNAPQPISSDMDDASLPF